MRQVRRCFGVQLIEGGKLKLVGFLSAEERDECCKVKSNHTRPITMKQWKEIPKELKA